MEQASHRSLINDNIFTGRDCARKLEDLDRQECEAACEGRMDNVLNGYCLSTTYVTTPPFPAQAFESTTPMTSSGPTNIENGSGASASERDEDANSTTLGPVIALGVLFCISVLLLAMVTIGWVCTCRYIMTKRDAWKKNTVELKG